MNKHTPWFLKFSEYVSDPKRIALFIASVTTVFVTVFYTLIFLIFYEREFHIVPLIITDISIFLFVFFISAVSIQNFIYDKIRLIYKNIRDLKLQKGEKPDIKKRSNILKEVNQEVEEWRKKHVTEITDLKESETFRREFLGNISHELKNPIFNIQGYVYTLIDGAKDDPELLEKYLKRTAKNIDRIINIIQDLDTISELEIKNLKPDFKSFDFLHTAREVVELFEEKAKRKNIKIFFREKYSASKKVFGDEHRIKQVLVNLIENAVKYSKEEGKIKISIFDMDQNYLVEVTDEGPGIAKDDIPRIFERFYRTDKARSREKGGTGLGLAIVKHIIEAHNQTINVRSTLGVGSTFAFTLKKA
jgi:two-component system phosphate regulon sensor histidine kinase PhoR